MVIYLARSSFVLKDYNVKVFKNSRCCVVQDTYKEQNCETRIDDFVEDASNPGFRSFPVTIKFLGFELRFISSPCSRIKQGGFAFRFTEFFWTEC